METIVIIAIVIIAVGYLAYVYGGAIKGLFFSNKSVKVKLPCGHCSACPTKKKCSKK